MATNALILIVEDEPEIISIVTAYLEREGFRTVSAAEGQTALDLHRILKPDLVVLDIGLPRFDGWEVLSALRHTGWTPVVMLTAMDQDLDKIQGLRLGADDYVVKPFNPVELVARVKAILRRSERPGIAHSALRAGVLEIDLESHAASIVLRGQRRELLLTLTEFRLLAHMARSPQRVFSRSELIDACLPDGIALERTLDSHLSNLRRKLVDAGAEGYVTNVRGVGYRLGSSL
jgi:two-component system response regulator AdeR